MGARPGLSAIRAAATGQRLDALDLFTRLLIEGGVPEVDVAVQTRVGVILASGGWVRVGCARLTGVHSDLRVCVGRVPGCGEHLRDLFFIRRPHSLIIATLLQHF